jgi:hypothetical protein
MVRTVCRATLGRVGETVNERSVRAPAHLLSERCGSVPPQSVQKDVIGITGCIMDKICGTSCAPNTVSGYSDETN